MDKGYHYFYEQLGENLLVEGDFLIEKFQGKGGWTFIRLPQIPPSSNKPFGSVRVKGKIDNHAIQSLYLMPMGDGTLFLSLKKEVRKAISKKEGDFAKVILYEDTIPSTLTEELLLCLNEYPKALDFFQTLSHDTQAQHIHWIYSAKSDFQKEERMVEWIEKLELGIRHIG